MNWISILTALVLALASAGLVLLAGWPLLAVAGAAALICVLVLAGAMLITPRAERGSLLRVVVNTIRKDLRQLRS